MAKDAEDGMDEMKCTLSGGTASGGGSTLGSGLAVGTSSGFTNGAEAECGGETAGDK